MSMFDPLLKEVTTRFGLGDKANALLKALLTLIDNPQTGGLSGFLARFNQQGLGDLVTSWVTGVPNKPLSSTQLENSLGWDTIKRIATQVGLPQPTASSALAYLVPEVVNLLTPNNFVPNALPASVTAPLTRAGGSAAAATTSRSWLWTILIPLLLLGLLAFFGIRSCGPQQAQQVAAPPPPAVVPPAASIAPRLSLKNIAGKLDYSGLVADEKTKQSIVDQLKAIFGAGNINGDIKVNPAVTPAGWLTQLGAFLSSFKLPGAELLFEGDKINVGGSISDADKQGLVDKLKATFGAPYAISWIAPRLSLKNIAGKLDYSGLVAEEKTKQSIVDQLKAIFGAGNINGDIKVNPAVTPAGWLTQLGTFLSSFKLPGAELLFEGDKINVGGSISDADKQGLVDKLKAIFGAPYTIGGLPKVSGFNVDEAVKAASQKAFTALSQLKPGFSAQDLVSALNLSIINFASDSVQIPASDKDLIERAANAIKAAPAGLKLEIGGHTDNTGDAAANLQLSQARAEAVRADLIKLGISPEVLIAKGYGSSKPIASNDTEAGRFQNRRIEYAILKQ